MRTTQIQKIFTAASVTVLWSHTWSLISLVVVRHLRIVGVARQGMHVLHWIAVEFFRTVVKKMQRKDIVADEE
jgi:hypothetical protein